MEWLSGGLMVIAVVVFVISLAIFHRVRYAFIPAGLIVLGGWLYSSVFEFSPSKLPPETAFWGTIFVFGTIWFWLLVAASVIIMLSLIEYENDVPATLTLLATLLVLEFLGDIKVFSYLFKHPAWSAVWVTGYLGAGVAWALGKWYFYARAEKRKYDKIKKAYLKSRNIVGDDIPAEHKVDWKEHVLRNLSREEVVPQFDRHEARFLMWMMHWPWSLAWTLIDDPIKRLFKEIYHQLKKTGQAIANAAFRGVEKDLPTAAEEAEYRRKEQEEAERRRNEDSRNSGRGGGLSRRA